MMKRLFALLFVLAAPAAAMTNQIDVYFGRATPRSDAGVGQTNDRVGSRGTDWKVEALHKTGPRSYLGIGFGRFRSNQNTSTTFISNSTSLLSSKISSTFLLGRVDLLAAPSYSIYGIAGIGLVRNSLHIAASPSTTWTDTGTSEVRTIVEDAASALGYAGGLGIDVNLTDRIVLGAEARYQGSQKKDFSLTSEGSSLSGASSIHTDISILFMGFKIGLKY